jgi:hypothetical protein
VNSIMLNEEYEYNYWGFLFTAYLGVSELVSISAIRISRIRGVGLRSERVSARGRISRLLYPSI